MSVNLDQILGLVGPLDDGGAFDSPRERYRRFLREYVTTFPVLRSLFEQARFSPGEQHQRALVDLVVLAGGFLGFEVEFGQTPSPYGPGTHGVWHAPGRLRVLVEVGGLGTALVFPTTTPAAVTHLSWSGTPVVSLFVPINVLAGNRGAARQLSSAVFRELSVDDHFRLAELTMEGKLAPVETMRMLHAGIPVDFVAGLLDRPATAAAAAEPAVSVAPATARPRSGFWIASVLPDHATTPEEFLELVVGRRHVFGVTAGGTVVGTVRTVEVGDGICFYLAGKGIVGHAWVSSTSDAASDLRDPQRFRQVLRLDRLALHLAAPRPLDPETELRLTASSAMSKRQGQMLLEISEDSFRELAKAEGKLSAAHAEPPAAQEGHGLPHLPSSEVRRRS
jgi:hypothetical protein